MRTESFAAVAFSESRAVVEPYLPKVMDYRGARLALIRLQLAYELPLKDLLAGKVAGYRAEALSQQDALSIGLTAVNATMPNEAIHWLTASFEHRQEPRVADHQIHHALAKAYALVSTMTTFSLHYFAFQVVFAYVPHC